MLQIILIGQLMFLLVLKQQWVTKEITMATIAMAMGKPPTRDSIEEALKNQTTNIYLNDYKQFRSKEWSLMNLLLTSGISNARENINLLNTTMIDDYMKFKKLRIEVGEEQFWMDVQHIIVDIVYKTLFGNNLEASKYLKKGFFSLVNTVATTTNVSERDKKEILAKILDGVEVEGMTAFFST